MNFTIEQALGTQYFMFYHAQWPANLLKPVCSLSQCINEVNWYIKIHSKDIDKWAPDQQDAVARLMWVNWIYQRLGSEPIRKPVLTHLEDSNHVVDCGDTRLMALNLLQDPGAVGVVCVVTADQVSQYLDWTPVCTNQDLIKVAGFGVDATVWVHTGHGQAIEWLEIGDHTTAHHLHSVDQRVVMMQNYLDQHPDVVFDTDWARSDINWLHYAN